MGARTPEITVNPDLLRWARETIGFDVKTAAKKVAVEPAVIREWEKEASSISIAKLRKIANAYKRSLALFFLSQVPAVPAFPPDFRTLDSTKTDDLSPEVRLAVRRAQRNREFYVELQEAFGEKWASLNFSFSLEEDAGNLAAQLRERIGIDTATQFAWQDKSEALKRWVNAVERLGILVFQMSLPLGEMRAFCLRDHSLPPAIVLNTKDDQHGRIFSLMHEMSHILLKQEDIEKIKIKRGEQEAHKSIEGFANSFAGSFLVPADSLLQNQYAKEYLSSKSDNSFQRLKGQYKVSGEVILRRFLDLAQITEREYQEKRNVINREIEQYREREQAKKRDKKGFRSVSMESFQRAGALLTAHTFKAIEQGKISEADAARFYEIKQQHISKIKKLSELRGQQGDYDNGH